jgi:hypothetical protein
MHKVRGSTWDAGDLIAGYKPRRPGRAHWERGGRPEYTVLLCVEPRKLGPRGAVVKPALSASIRATSWAACVRAIRGLGFTAPHLTAGEVRRGP